MEEAEAQVAESSPETVEANVDESSPVEEASSSDAPITEPEAQVETEQSLLDVVQDAMPKEESDVNAEAEDKVSEQVESEEVAEVQTEVTDENLVNQEVSPETEDWTDVPFNKHPRFKELVAEKNQYKETSQMYENDSVNYRKITDFMDQNNLNTNDAVEGFRLMSAIRNSPEEAFKILQDHIDSVGQITGRTLPEDLQTKLNDGLLDEDAAKELSQARASVLREQELRKQAESETYEQQAQSHADYLTDVIKSWGERTIANDPDFTLKQDEFNDRVSALVSQRGRPKSENEVLAIANDAYNTVNERFKSRQPRKEPIRTATGGKLAGSPVAEPKSMRDVISNALAQESA